MIFIEELLICSDICPILPIRYYYYLNDCYLICPAKTYTLNDECVPCADECIECFGSGRSNCIKCGVNFFLEDTFCADNCSPFNPYKNQVTNTCDVFIENIKFLSREIALWEH